MLKRMPQHPQEMPSVMTGNEGNPEISDRP